MVENIQNNSCNTLTFICSNLKGCKHMIKVTAYSVNWSDTKFEGCNFWFTIHLSRWDGQLHTSIYDKGDYFIFHIRNFPFLSTNIKFILSKFSLNVFWPMDPKTNRGPSRNMVNTWCVKRKMKRSDSVLWQKSLHQQQKCQKGQSDNTNNATKKLDYTAAEDRLRTVSCSNYSHPSIINVCQKEMRKR